MHLYSEVKILLVDNDKVFCDSFIKELKSSHQDFRMDIECSNKVEKKHSKMDLYIVSQKVNNIKECLNQINFIRNNNLTSPIFVISNFKDFNFMKKLIKLKVSGFIDKDQMDLSSLAEQAIEIYDTRTKVCCLISKLNHLESLNRVS